MPFSLAHFLSVLEIRDDAGLPYVIIGGQAVNYWAETYLSDEPELARFLPFVSKDLDFLGGRADVLKTARLLGGAARLPHRKMMTAFAGGVALKIMEAETNVEFIRTVPGVSAAESNRWAVASQRDGVAVRVLDPISMLACKLHLALTVDQTQRRDGDHARILLLCTRAFLRATLRGVETGAWPTRGWLAAAERVLKLAETTTGAKAARQLGVDWRQVLPHPEIDAGLRRLIIRFREQRLAQWLKKMDRRSAKIR